MRALALVVLVTAAAGCPTQIGPGADAGPVSDAGTVVTCVDDQECAPGFCLNGLCSTAQCQSKSGCSSDQVCALGVCGAPPATCESSEDCAGTRICDGFTHSCFDPNNPDGEGEGEGAAGEGEGAAGGEGEGAAGGEGEGETIDVSGYVIENRQNDPVTQASVLPNNTVVFAGHTVVIGRNASKADFENFWGPMPNTVLYLNGNAGASGVPIVNGGETWALLDDNGNVVDGPTIVGSTAKSYQRTSAGSASSSSNWSTGADTTATPGVTALGAGSGLKISEWSDASGNGNFDFEFIELSWQP